MSNEWLTNGKNEKVMQFMNFSDDVTCLDCASDSSCVKCAAHLQTICVELKPFVELFVELRLIQCFQMALSYLMKKYEDGYLKHYKYFTRAGD